MSKSKACAYKSQAAQGSLEVTQPHTCLGDQSPEEPGERTPRTNSELQILFLKGYKSPQPIVLLCTWRVSILVAGNGIPAKVFPWQ